MNKLSTNFITQNPNYNQAQHLYRGKTKIYVFGILKIGFNDYN